MKPYHFWVNLQWKDITELQFLFLDFRRGSKVGVFLRILLYTLLKQHWIKVLTENWLNPCSRLVVHVEKSLWHKLCEFDLQRRFGVFVNLLLCEECLYIECILFWHMPYKLIESYLKVTTLSEGFSQTLQLRFRTSKTIQNWANMVVYFTVIARADSQLYLHFPLTSLRWTILDQLALSIDEGQLIARHCR